MARRKLKIPRPDITNLRVQWPRRKEHLTMRVDEDIMAWFRNSGGRGYQTRMHAVLRAFVEAQQ